MSSSIPPVSDWKSHHVISIIFLARGSAKRETPTTHIQEILVGESPPPPGPVSLLSFPFCAPLTTLPPLSSQSNVCGAVLVKIHLTPLIPHHLRISSPKASHNVHSLQTNAIDFLLIGISKLFNFDFES